MINGLQEDNVLSCMGKEECKIDTTPVYIDRCNRDSTYLVIEYVCMDGKIYYSSSVVCMYTTDLVWYACILLI